MLVYRGHDLRVSVPDQAGHLARGEVEDAPAVGGVDEDAGGAGREKGEEGAAAAVAD